MLSGAFSSFKNFKVFGTGHKFSALNKQIGFLANMSLKYVSGQLVCIIVNIKLLLMLLLF